MTASTQNLSAAIDCREFFSINWKLWKLLGVTSAVAKQRFKYRVWSYFINTIVTFMFPLHLFLEIFNPAATKAELFESIAIFTTSLGAASKLVIFSFNMNNVTEMERILQTLDKRIKFPEDNWYFAHHFKRTLIIMDRFYVVIYYSIGFFICLACIVRGEQKLIYPGWFPFNWKQSWWHFSAALCFQVNGIFFQIMQNLISDCFLPKALLILAGHVKLLYRRVARLGYDESLMLVEHETELNECILHQKDLYGLFDTIQKIISWPMFLQLFVSLINLGVALVTLAFFVTDIFYRIYYVMYFVGMMLQLLPVCYFGCAFVIFFERLHYAAFSCNWIGQSKRFKRHLMLFTERSLKVTIARAGGMFPIHLATFFATCKGAYSMFTVLITMK